MRTTITVDARTDDRPEPVLTELPSTSLMPQGPTILLGKGTALRVTGAGHGDPFVAQWLRHLGHAAYQLAREVEQRGRQEVRHG